MPTENLENNLETLYNNIGLEKTKNIPIQDILPLRNGSGIRNNQQISNLRKNIKENGIVEQSKINNMLPTKETSKEASFGM